MKEMLLKFCFLASVIYVLYFIIPFSMFIYDIDLYKRISNIMFKSTLGRTITYILGVLSFVLWINNLIFWQRNDKKFFRLFLLFMFSIFYTPIYFLVRKRYDKTNSVI